MIDFTHYIKAKSVVDTYLKHLKDLNGTTLKQHFITRLSLCDGYKDKLKDNRTKTSLFEFTKKDLERKLKMSFDELWDEFMSIDRYGYKKEIKKTNNDDIKFYFGMTDIIGLVCILLRNDIELPEDIEKKINRRYLLKMIDIAKDDEIMRNDQATTYVNGIGLIICLKQLKNSLVPIDWSVINECYKGIWNFYIENIGKSQEWLRSSHKSHNYIYGLTHCVINISNYYTRFIGNNDQWMDEIIATRNVLINLVESQKRFNYVLFSDDALAEILLTIKLCGADECIERITALNALSLRFNSQKLMFDAHKEDTLKEEILRNEHTNILYILNVLL